MDRQRMSRALRVGRVAMSAVSPPPPPPPMTKTTDGLLAEYQFADLSGWTVGTGWTAVSDPGYTAWPTSRVLLDRIAASSDTGGLREPQLITSGDNWTLFYDAGDGSNLWGIQRATSTDAGLTWTRHGRVTFDHGSTSGSITSWCNASWITQSGGSWYYEVLGAESGTIVPDIPYLNSVYRLDGDLSSIFTWVNDSPPLGSAGDFDESSVSVSSVFFDGSQWVGYYSGRHGTTDYNIGRATKASISGSWVKDGAGAVLPVGVLYDSGACENPKVWNSSFLSKWVILANNNRKSATSIWLASTEADFRTADVYQRRVQHRNADLDTRNEISVSAPFCTLTGAVIQRTTGEVPFVYAGDADPGAPDVFQWHRMRAGYLEPSLTTAQFSGGSAVYLSRTGVGQDFVAEYQLEAHASAGTQNITFMYRMTGGTSDGGSSGYALDVNFVGQVVRLYELSSGSFTQLGSDYTPQHDITGDARNSNTLRIKLVVSGSSHKVYVHGHLAMNVTDSAHAGTLMGFRANTGPANVRRLRFRRGDTVTVNNLGSASLVVLRGFGGYPIDSAVPSAGSVSLSLPYGRAEIIDIDSARYTPAGGIVGGDVYTL